VKRRQLQASEGASSRAGGSDYAVAPGGVLIALRENQARFNAFLTLLAYPARMGPRRADSVRNRGSQQRLAARLISVLLVVGALAGCAQAPVPDTALANAEIAVTRARTAGAERHAPVELARAEEKLQAAHAAVRVKAHARARALAEQALVDAELAEVEAQAAQAEATARHLRQLVQQQHRRVAATAEPSVE
jgi:hypothetical protein